MIPWWRKLTFLVLVITKEAGQGSLKLLHWQCPVIIWCFVTSVSALVMWHESSNLSNQCPDRVGDTLKGQSVNHLQPSTTDHVNGRSPIPQWQRLHSPVPSGWILWECNALEQPLVEGFYICLLCGNTFCEGGWQRVELIAEMEIGHLSLWI